MDVFSFLLSLCYFGNKDARGIVEKISRFLGKDLSPETLDAITEHCSFDNMKTNPMTSMDSLLLGKADERKEKQPSTFMRKGGLSDQFNKVTQGHSLNSLINIVTVQQIQFMAPSLIMPR